MSSCLILELNSFAVAVVLLMLFNLRHSSAHMLDDLLFREILILTVAVLASDTGGWLMERQAFSLARPLLYIFDTLYFCLSGILCFSWLLYVNCKIREDFGGFKRSLPLYSIPALLVILLAVFSPSTGWLFQIGPGNLYSRGSLYWLQSLLCWFYPLDSIGILAARLRREISRLRRNEYWCMIAFVSLPILGGLLQTFFYGLPLLWIFAVVALLIIFINIQNEQISLDALTGINNRGRLNKFLAARLSASVPEGQTLYLLLMDVNDFKKINDRYGHTAGDAVLVRIASVLKTVSSRTGRRDFLARYGGDEFAAICLRRDEEEIQRCIQEIHRTAELFFPEQQSPYPVTLSIGYAKWDPESMSTVDELISAADHSMYEKKFSGKPQPSLPSCI